MNTINNTGKGKCLHRNTLRRGFTLVEILTAVVIIAILAIMAMPLYEKTIERSRLTEARAMLNRLQAAKNYTMENMDCTTFVASDKHCPKLKHLNIAFTFKNVSKPNDWSICSEDFCYSINPGGNFANGVCARRLKGEYAGTSFFYFGESDKNADFQCHGEKCEEYGITNSGSSSCN